MEEKKSLQWKLIWCNKYTSIVTHISPSMSRGKKIRNRWKFSQSARTLIYNIHWAFIEKVFILFPLSFHTEQLHIVEELSLREAKVLFCFVMALLSVAGDVVLVRSGDLRTKALRLFDLLIVGVGRNVSGVVWESFLYLPETKTWLNGKPIKRLPTHPSTTTSETNWFDASDGCSNNDEIRWKLNIYIHFHLGRV